MGKMEKKIFVVMSCDEWMSYYSMRLRFCSTSWDKVKSYILQHITKDDFAFGGEDLPAKTQREMFEANSSSKIDAINDMLKYGIIYECVDGEEF